MSERGHHRNRFRPGNADLHDPAANKERRELLHALYKAHPPESLPQRRIPTPRSLYLLYKGNVRSRPYRELFAVFGIAAGVALLYAAQVANHSVTGSFEQLARGVAGRASLEVASRSPEGFDERLYFKIRRLPSVERAAPVVETRIALRGPKGRRPLTLYGADDRLALLGGSLVSRYGQSAKSTPLGLQITQDTAEATGASQGDQVEVEVGEKLKRLSVADVLGKEAIGELSKNPVALAQLGIAQRITGLHDRLSRVLVAPKPGQDGEARRELLRLAEGKLNVRSSMTEARLLSQAAAPDRQSTALFSAISLLIGLLLAYNAMLLTLPDRRRQIANLQASWGWGKARLMSVVIFEALAVGVLGSILGLILGDQLSRYVFNETPGFLATAFAIGTQRIVTPEIVALSFAGGLIAALAASWQPIYELARMPSFGAAFSASEPQGHEPKAVRARLRLAAIGAFVIASSAAVMLLAPETTLILLGAFVLGVVMTLPALVGLLIATAGRIVRRTSSAPATIAIGELVTSPTRATALAATGVVAVFAIMALTGTADDLERGGLRTSTYLYGSADLWVARGDEESFYLTDPFEYHRAYSRIAEVPGVAGVDVDRGGFIDLGGRRVRILGVSHENLRTMRQSQLVQGDLELAKQRIGGGGWAAMTSSLARMRDLAVGETFSLPTPDGLVRLRLAATTINYGWFPGAMLLSARDAAALLGSTKTSAVEVDVEQGVPLTLALTTVRASLGNATSLQVRTEAERGEITGSVVRQGLLRLRQIATLATIAVILAVAAAMLGAVWRRRKRLWSLVSLGIRGPRLYEAVFLEAAIVLLIGCLIGAGFGLVGQFLMGRWLEVTTQSPMEYVPAAMLGLKTLGLITLLAAIATIIPVRLAFPITSKAVFAPD